MRIFFLGVFVFSEIEMVMIKWNSDDGEAEVRFVNY